MLKLIKNVKLIFILILVLLAFVFVNIPSSSAKFADFYDCYSFVEIDYDENLSFDPLVPINRTLTIPIDLTYYVRGYIAEQVAQVYTNSGLYPFIYLTVKDKPNWCNATISPSVLLLPASYEGVTEKINLTVHINRNSKAFDNGDIELEVKVDKMGAVQGSIETKNISFTAGYFPLLGIDTPDGNLVSIDPSQEAEFDIGIKNLCNAKSYIEIKILDKPKDWTVNIPNEIIMNKGDETEIQLSAKSPSSFGYHNYRETVTISIKPYHFEDRNLQGKEYILTFLVKDKGFDTPGFEFVFIIFGLILITLILNHNKNKKGGKNK